MKDVSARMGIMKQVAKFANYVRVLAKIVMGVLLIVLNV